MRKIEQSHPHTESYRPKNGANHRHDRPHHRKMEHDHPHLETYRPKIEGNHPQNGSTHRQNESYRPKMEHHHPHLEADRPNTEPNHPHDDLHVPKSRPDEPKDPPVIWTYRSRRKSAPVVRFFPSP